MFGSLYDGAKKQGLKLYARLIETIKILLSLFFLVLLNFSCKIQSIIFSIWTILVF